MILTNNDLNWISVNNKSCTGDGTGSLPRSSDWLSVSNQVDESFFATMAATTWPSYASSQADVFPSTFTFAATAPASTFSAKVRLLIALLTRSLNFRARNMNSFKEFFLAEKQPRSLIGHQMTWNQSSVLFGFCLIFLSKLLPYIASRLQELP